MANVRSGDRMGLEKSKMDDGVKMPEITFPLKLSHFFAKTWAIFLEHFSCAFSLNVLGQGVGPGEGRGVSPPPPPHRALYLQGLVGTPPEAGF